MPFQNEPMDMRDIDMELFRGPSGGFPAWAHIVTAIDPPKAIRIAITLLKEELSKVCNPDDLKIIFTEYFSEVDEPPKPIKPNTIFIFMEFIPEGNRTVELNWPEEGGNSTHH